MFRSWDLGGYICGHPRPIYRVWSTRALISFTDIREIKHFREIEWNKFEEKLRLPFPSKHLCTSNDSIK